MNEPIIVNQKPKMTPSQRVQALKLLMEQEKAGDNDLRYIEDLELSIADLVKQVG